MSSLALIRERVSATFGVPIPILIGDRRSRDISRPRMVGMYLSKELTKHSLPTIAHWYGCSDHSSTAHAARRIPALMGSDPDFRSIVLGLRASITSDLGEQGLASDIAEQIGSHLIILLKREASKDPLRFVEACQKLLADLKSQDAAA